MHYLVPWSGGLDSTYLVYKLLKEGHNVTAVCFDMNPQVKSYQDVRQREAISKIRKLFSEDYSVRLEILTLYDEIDIRAFSTRNAFAFVQFPTIINAILYTLVPEHDYVALGYVVGDDIMSWMNDIVHLFNAWKPFLRENEYTELVLPLAKMSKYHIYHSLPSEIRKYVTWCESEREVTHRGCGSCRSCLKMKSYIDGIEFEPQLDLSSILSKEDRTTIPTNVKTRKRKNKNVGTRSQ